MSVLAKSQSIGGGGIGRVIQRDKKKMGQNAKMSNKPSEKAEFKRMGDSLTPRKA